MTSPSTANGAEAKDGRVHREGIKEGVRREVHGAVYAWGRPEISLCFF
jgi:hypothetical protein